jgi:hypothetical protein
MKQQEKELPVSPYAFVHPMKETVFFCRSPRLTTLRLVSFSSCVFSKRLASLIKESPLRELRSLELEDVNLNLEELTALLENCPVLEVLLVCYCFQISGEDEHALRAKFPRIRTMTIRCDEQFRCGSHFEWDEYDVEHRVLDFDDEMTDGYDGASKIFLKLNSRFPCCIFIYLLCKKKILANATVARD